jgi:hypothetical protein
MAKEEKEVKSTYMEAIYEPTIRRIVQVANEQEIKKEQIVSLLKQGEQYVLVYYK